MSAPASGDSAGATNSTPVASDSTFVLKPGDKVRISVWKDTTMSGDFVVGVNGALLHPLYQSVPVAGIPIPEVQQRLQKFLTQFESNPEVVVEPMFRVVVNGAVRTPQVYQLPRETSISMAIAQAGGPLPGGRLDKVRLWREGKEYTLDLTHADAAWANAPVMSGDQIIVTESSHFFRNVFVPIASLVGSTAAIINLIRR
ncbi:MAG TPA: polysaccharide biosynthesis/export family protein [Gemmatimonadaceae bacterium]|nr:polysaccharide biosynthesis/export family protein [Gemmatimonadaceae bacterium]